MSGLFRGFSLRFSDAKKTSESAKTDAISSYSDNLNEDSQPALIMGGGSTAANNDRLGGSHNLGTRNTSQPRRSPRKKNDTEATELQSPEQELANSEMASSDKPVLKLFLKSPESLTGATSSDKLHGVQSEKNVPTMLRLRFSSSEDRVERSPETQDNASSPNSIHDSLIPRIQPNGSASKDAVQKLRGRPKKMKTDGPELPKSKLPRKPRAKKQPDSQVENLQPDSTFESSQKQGQVKKPRKNAKKDAFLQEQPGIINATEKPARRKREKTASDQEKSVSTTQTSQSIDEEVLSGTVPNEIQRHESQGTESKVRSVESDDICSACRTAGTFVSCATCPTAYHSACLFPPLRVDANSWRCTACRYKDSGSLDELKQLDCRRPDSIDTYQDLWDSVRSDIVISGSFTFNLPKRLRPKKEIAFSLELLDDSAYQIQPRRRASTSESRKGLSQTNYRRAPRSNASQWPTPTISSRISESGQCHYCGQRSIVPELLPQRADPIVPRPLIHCDYCHLLWHLDCVDPPLTAIPPAEGKWVCPAHVNLPIHPNFIPDVELESGDPFEYEIAMRLSIPPPAQKYLLPETSIRLDFGMKAKKMRGDSL